VTTQATVSLLRWLRRQLREPSPLRERLEAAIANDDPGEARRIVKNAPFSDTQRRHIERLLDEWESATR
jgi:ATP phosphoribosyltransferase regulatory subunit HisZ